MVIKKPTRIRNNGTIQLQFFHRCSVVATGSKFVNGLLCFWRITFRLTKSIRIVRCFRSLSCLFYFRNFLRLFFTYLELDSSRQNRDSEAQSGAFSNREHGLFHPKYFDNGPLERG